MWLVPFRYFIIFLDSSSNIHLEFWLLLLEMIPPYVCIYRIVNSYTATVLLIDGTSQHDLTLKPTSHLTLLLVTDDMPPGWLTSLSTILETHVGPYVVILSSKILPPLSLNNTNSFLDNHVSFLYAIWVCSSILSTIIDQTWSLQTVPCATL